MPSNGPLQDLVGKSYGDLTVIEYRKGTKKKKAQWLCLCACGNQRLNSTDMLNSGNSSSCGCTKGSRIGAKKRTHGHSTGSLTTRTYRIWTNMKTRCTNPKATQYKFYGGRGIGVCDKWSSFGRFLEDMGECPPGMTIERKDVNADYSKENCIWATWSTQANNKRSTRWLNIEGSMLSMSSASRAYGVSVSVIWSRLERGWSDAEAVGAAPRKRLVYNRHTGSIGEVKTRT
jgi:hypothetical protein